MGAWYKKSSGLPLSFDLPRNARVAILQLCDGVAFCFIIWAAYVLRVSDWWPEPWLSRGWAVFPVMPILALLVFWKLGLYRELIDAVNPNFLAVAAVCSISIVLIFYVFVYTMQIRIPRSVPFIFGLLIWSYLGASRFILKGYFSWLANRDLSTKNVLIYGAGAAGRQLLASLNQVADVKVKGFIDDNVSIQGATLSGVKIFSIADAEPLIKRESVRAVLLALPSVSRQQRLSILAKLRHLNLEVRTIPSIEAILSGSEIKNFKKIEIDDLLGREPVAPDSGLMSLSIHGKSVCVTGGGGSIGSEIARQCVLNRAKRLIIFDSSESALYSVMENLNSFMISNSIDCELVSILGSVTNHQLMLRTFSDYEVDTVYHSAAHKHVPIVEKNPFEGVYNNSFGTRTAALAAKDSKVERFILISSDKAVRPTNIMGATKRVAELLLQDLAAEEGQKTIFSMVRFGNVLGSSGSVVPLFEKQIANGGPVTVTHPNVKRFFMSLSEAVELVIQAGSMAEGGEVFILDMGQSILISDLAELMISLSGFSIKSEKQPLGDIEIQFTGLRPGEKLEEELLIEDSSIGTTHPKIFSPREGKLSTEKLSKVILELETAVKNQDIEKLRRCLKETAIGYQPPIR